MNTLQELLRMFSTAGKAYPYRYNSQTGQWEKITTEGDGLLTVHKEQSSGTVDTIMSVTSGKKALVTSLIVDITGTTDACIIKENSTTVILKIIGGASSRYINMTGSLEAPVMIIAAGACTIGATGTDTANITMTYKEVDA